MHGSREFVPENHGWIVGEPIVEYVDVGSTDAGERDLDLHPLSLASGLGDVNQI
jgi:hypothetical protein